MIRSIDLDAKKKKKNKKSFGLFLQRSMIDHRRIMIFPLHDLDTAFTKLTNLTKKLRCEAKKFEIIRKVSLSD